MYIEPILRDIHPFSIKTDHAKLLYLNVPPSSKVLRWKIAIQKYDFKVTHIPGKDNIVANAFSRLINPEDEPINHLLPITRGNLRAPDPINDSKEMALEQDIVDALALPPYASAIDPLPRDI